MAASAEAASAAAASEGATAAAAPAGPAVEAALPGDGPTRPGEDAAASRCGAVPRVM